MAISTLSFCDNLQCAVCSLHYCHVPLPSLILTIPLLAQLLPKYDKHLHDNYRLVYAIIGLHQNGQWALYIGSTGKPRELLTCHKSNFKCSKTRRQPSQDPNGTLSACSTWLACRIPCGLHDAQDVDVHLAGLDREYHHNLGAKSRPDITKPIPELSCLKAGGSLRAYVSRGRRRGISRPRFASQQMSTYQGFYPEIVANRAVLPENNAQSSPILKLYV